MRRGVYCLPYEDPLTRQSPCGNRCGRNRRRDCRRRAQQSNFVGGTPAQLDAKAMRTLRLKFPAGSRSNWHSHSNGQLLMIEEGQGRTQERNGPLLEMSPGAPWFTKAGVEHWHGAAPDQDVGATDDLRRRRQMARAGLGRRLQGGAEKITNNE